MRRYGKYLRNLNYVNDLLKENNIDPSVRTWIF